MGGGEAETWRWFGSAGEGGTDENQTRLEGSWTQL